jgi:arylsulfatase A-like enzyme
MLALACHRSAPTLLHSGDAVADVPVIIIIADGVRPDTLGAALCPRDDRPPTAPAIARLRDEGAFHTVSSCFPSVTGPAYAPFLMGRYPGAVGLPGLRWFDRSRATCSFPTFARSYVGHQMRRVDEDLDPSAPTVFELSRRSVGALSVISRGLAPQDHVATFGVQSLSALRSAARVARTHFTGNVRGWLAIDREIGNEIVRRVRDERPDFVFAALTGIDKTSHAEGHDAPIVEDAIGIVDDVVARLRGDAEQLGYWDDLHIWITSDHGHSPVRAHDDLARGVADLGLRVMAHPFLLTIAPQVAVMVSGNAMAHVYVELERRRRPLWSALRPRWESLVNALSERDSVDLLLLPNERSCEVRSGARGIGIVTMESARFSYRRVDGDPLALGADVHRVDERDAYAATIDSDYPDALVQIATIARAPRSGDIILSAARGWDFRARYEPIPHVSSHGALHREHMLVPLVMNRAPSHTPLRTVDVMPSALSALGLPTPSGLDGRSFVAPGRQNVAA